MVLATDSSLSPNRPRASTKWNSLGISRGETDGLK